MEIRDGWSRVGKRAVPELAAATLNLPLDHPIVQALAGISTEPQATCDAAVAEFSNSLHGLFDQWIKSGRNPQDVAVENPWERSIFWESQTGAESIEKVLADYASRNPPRLLINRDSTLDILGGISNVTAKDALVRGRDRAVAFFLDFLNSPARERLFRCHKCHLYFVRSRAPRKNSLIYHGTFCESCKGAGSAKRTRESRNRRRRPMIERAADASSKWTGTRRQGTRVEWIRMNVNAKLPAGQAPVEVNWVTRHRKEIDEEVERRKHAKRKN